MEPTERPSCTAVIGRVELEPASSEEVRALITVMWELVNRFDRVLAKFETPHNDPRNARFDYNKPR